MLENELQNARIDTIDATGSQGMVIMPQGPVTQIYEAQKSIRTDGGAYIEKLEVAHLSLTVTADGGLVNQIAGAPLQLRPGPRPVLRLPDYVPRLIGRAAEVSTILAALETYRFVEVYGPVDIGKTALLEASAAGQTGQSWPDGALFLRPRQTTASDLLQELHAEFFTSSSPHIKVTDAQLTRDLQTICALVVLDNDRLPKEELEVLLAALSGSRIILSTRERGGRHPGRIRPVALRGVPLADARDLYRSTLGRPLSADESAAVDALIKEMDGNPGVIIRAAAIARDEQQAPPAPAAHHQPSVPPEAPATLEAQAQQVLAHLTADERSLVAVLATVFDARLGKAHLLSIADVAESSPALATLIHRKVIRTHSPRYSLVATFVPLALAVDDATGWQEIVTAYFVAWMRAPSTTADQILEESEAVMSLLRQATAAGRWRDVLPLARALEPALIAGSQWGAWRQVLDWQVQGGRALHDLAAEGWAFHQLGTRALCMGDAVEAQRLLNQALTIRDRLADRNGAAVTRHNLNLVQPPLPPASSSSRPATPSGTPPTSPLPPRYDRARGRQAQRGSGGLWLLVLATLTAIGVFWFVRPQGRWLSGVSLPFFTPPTALVPALVGPTSTQSAVVSATKAPPTKAPPTKAPPTKVSPTKQPPTKQPPTKEPPTKAPPTKEPSTEVPPTEVPPTEVPPTEIPSPQILSFSADIQQLAAGTGTYLRWKVLDATSIILEPYEIEVSGFSEYYVEPNETTSFALRATNTSGFSYSGEVIVEVTQPAAELPQPVILDFQAEPFEIEAGGSVQLCYSTANAFEVEIQPEVGSLSKLGKFLDQDCVEVIPKDEKSVYTLIVYDKDWQAVATMLAEVLVLAPG